MKKPKRKKETSPEELHSSEARSQFDLYEQHKRRLHRARQRINKTLESVQEGVANHIDSIHKMAEAEKVKSYLADYMGDLDPTLEKINNETQKAFQKDIEALRRDAWAVADNLIASAGVSLYTPKNKTKRPKRKAPSPKKASPKVTQTKSQKAYQADYRGFGMVEYIKKLEEDNEALQTKLKKANESYVGKRDAFFLVMIVVVMVGLALIFI